MKKSFRIPLVIAMTILTSLGCSITSRLSLPVYSMEQVDSQHEGYRRTTLTAGDTIYVCDYEEYAIGSITSAPTEKIGKLPFGFGSAGVYAIPGQDPSAYVLEFDPMYQQVYRNIDHPPFDWRTAEFQSIRLMILTANPKESEDPLLIEEILFALKGENPAIVPMQSDGNYSGVTNYTLLLFSDQLPGLMYMAGVHVKETGEVYLAENIVSNQWHSAGTLFSEWVLK